MGIAGDYDPKKASEKEKKAAMIRSGGYVLDDDSLRRISNYNYGREQGQKEFYDDPDMQNLRKTREDLAKGYDGEELGALRQTARGEVAGQRSSYLRGLASNLARGGVGGARGAAVRGAADQKYAVTNADNERKLALDSAKMKRDGQNDLQDFVFRQKYGALTMGTGNAQLGAADYAAQQAKQQNYSGSQPCCFIFLEARYGDGTMDFVVRKFRDENMTPMNRRGYYKLSEVLVPLMRKSRIIKGAVRLFMTDPLVAYGKAHYGTGSKLGFIFTPIKNFWLKTFEYLGGEHPFVRENGEVI